eukprot:1218353-Pyramimonas_sp.AAC.1
MPTTIGWPVGHRKCESLASCSLCLAPSWSCSFLSASLGLPILDFFELPCCPRFAAPAAAEAADASPPPPDAAAAAPVTCPSGSHAGINRE